MSDTAAVQSQLKWGLPTDCPTNPLCGAPGGALRAVRHHPDTIAGATLLSACDTPMADALKAKTIDVAELCSTQPDIIVNGWVVLDDDKQTQPADNISPIVRNDYLAKVDTDFVREAPERRLGQDRYADAGRPVQAGRRRPQGSQGRREPPG